MSSVTRLPNAVWLLTQDYNLGLELSDLTIEEAFQEPLTQNCMLFSSGGY